MRTSALHWSESQRSRKDRAASSAAAGWRLLHVAVLEECRCFVSSFLGSKVPYLASGSDARSSLPWCQAVADSSFNPEST